VSTKLICGSSRVSSQPLNGFDLKQHHELFPHSFVYQRVLDEEKIIDSLQEILRINPYFSGRIISHEKASGRVILNNGGAEFSVERIEKNIPKYGIDNPLKKNSEYFCPLVNTVGFSEKTPLLKVRLFQFNDGSILSMTASHQLTDGAGLFEFMKDWAAVANGREPGFREHDRFALTHNFEGAEKSLLNRLRELANPGLEENHSANEVPITKIIRISQALIRRIMEEQRTEKKGGAWVSAQDVLTALLWKNLIDFNRIDKDEKISLLTAYNIRRLLSLPPNYVGNAVTNRLIDLLVKNVMDLSVVGVARVLRESIESLKKEDCLNDLMFWDGLLNEEKQQSFFFQKTIPNNWVVINNLSKFGWDKVDFGGEPVWFDIPAFPNVNRRVFILPSPLGNDFDCHVCLSEGEMEVFEKKMTNAFPGEILVSPVCKPLVSQG